MSENTEDLSLEQFVEAVSKAGLTKAFERYTQSVTDKKVEAIIQKRDNTEIQKLTERINDLTLLVSQGNREQIVKGVLKKIGLHEKFLPHITGDSPQAIEESCQSLLASVTEHVQGGINKKLQAGELAPPAKGTPGSAGIALPDIQQFAKEQNLKENVQKGSETP